MRINVTDVNNNAPAFAQSNVIVEVREDHDVTSPIYRATATDQDHDANADVTYSLSLNPQNLFDIDPATGEVRLTSSLDYEATRSHLLTIVASDGGASPLTAQLEMQVRVADVNDNAPRFASDAVTFSVSESVGLNHVLASVRATDDDATLNARISYSMTSPDDADVFGVFADDGSIYNKVRLDREARERYDFTIVATDAGSPARSASVLVTVEVEDANDNSPVFLENSYSFYALENEPQNTRVDAVSATDIDVNLQPIAYSIAPNDYVSIDAQSGELRTKTPLDRERTETIELTVTATDSGSPRRSTSVDVTVHLLDENDNAPSFDRAGGYAVTLAENRPRDTLVLIVSATDPDRNENATITYAFHDNPAHVTEHFHIAPQTGQIKLRAPLDFETRNFFSIGVVARDGGEPQQQSFTKVNVTVKDENDLNPELNFTQLSLSVRENTPLATEVGHVSGDCSTRYSDVIFYIVDGNELGTFAVNSTTGAIVVGRPVDYEESSFHLMQVRELKASAGVTCSSIVNVNIAVDDVNDNPPRFDQNPIRVTVVENKPIGSTVHTFTTTDADSGTRGRAKFEIVSQSGNESLFRINENTGALITARDLDFEQVRQVSLVIRATDKPLDPAEALHATVTTIVDITDRNDERPVFHSRAIVYVMEDEPVGFPVETVSASDADSGPNGHVTYLIASGNERSHFSLNSESGEDKFVLYSIHALA